MSRCSPSLNDRQSAPHNLAAGLRRFYADLGFICVRSAVCFVRNQVAGEEFEHAFGGAYHGSDVEPDVNSARKQTFLLDLVTRQSNGKDRPNDRNGFDDTFGDSPATGPKNSAFECGHHRASKRDSMLFDAPKALFDSTCTHRYRTTAFLPSRFQQQEPSPDLHAARSGSPERLRRTLQPTASGSRRAISRHGFATDSRTRARREKSPASVSLVGRFAHNFPGCG